MRSNILESRELEKCLNKINRREIKVIKKLREDYHKKENQFNKNDFQIGDIIYLTIKHYNKEHNQNYPCKILSELKYTAKNKHEYINVKILNRKSKSGKLEIERIFLNDILESKNKIIFTNKKVSENYLNDYINKIPYFINS